MMASRRLLLALMSLALATATGIKQTASARAAQQLEPAPDGPPSHDAAIAHAFEQRQRAVAWGDQPFGAVIVQNGIVVGEGPSRVVLNGDPTAHAEMESIRDACRQLGTRDLTGCAIYSTSRPCRMCEAALSWAHVSRMYYGSSGIDAGPPGSGLC